MMRAWARLSVSRDHYTRCYCLRSPWVGVYRTLTTAWPRVRALSLKGAAGSIMGWHRGRAICRQCPEALWRCYYLPPCEQLDIGRLRFEQRSLMHHLQLQVLYMPKLL